MSTGKSGRPKGGRRGAVDERGFTLIEVLVALTILSFGLLAIASMQITAIQTTGGAKTISTGVAWAEDKLELLTSLGYDNLSLNPGAHDEGDTPEIYKITWTVANNAPRQNCKLITVNVQSNERGRVKNTTLTGIKPQF